VPSSMMPHVRGGKIKGLAMFSSQRLPSVPDVPTIVESGGPALESATWVMFLAPAGTSVDIIRRVAAETIKAVGSADVKARFEQQGIQAAAGTPGDAAKFLGSEIDKWAKVIKTANVKPE
jgi:tripartite-type tricarboxylate transporter receptor subunit TctC